MTENKKENEKLEELENTEDEDIQVIDEDEMDHVKGGGSREQETKTANRKGKWA